jgi:signal transduction histidine kinase
MGEMAAGLAHEIRNPLVSIGATLEMLSKETDGATDRGAILADLVEEVNRIDMILKEYLSLSIRQNTSVTRVHLDTLMSDSIQILKGTMKANDIVVIKDIDPQLEIFGDYIGLRQVIINLLKNAIDATPNGKNVRCHATQDAGEVQIFIDDEGRGLLFDSKDCFRPFFTTKKNGTGLGLAVCKKILAAHGGSIYLGNREAGGCRASIALPRGLEIERNTKPNPP